MKLDDVLDRDMRIAWHVAALSRQQRLPKLSTLMSREHRQTSSDHRRVLHTLSEQYGIPLRAKR